MWTQCPPLVGIFGWYDHHTPMSEAILASQLCAASANSEMTADRVIDAIFEVGTEIFL